MESGSVYLHSFLLAQHSGQTLFQLACGLVGESDSKDVPGFYRINSNGITEGICVVGLSCGIVLQKSDILFAAAACFIIESVAELYHICDTVDDNGSLTASRTCQHENRAVHSEHCFLLHIVHAAEIFF